MAQGLDDGDLPSPPLEKTTVPTTADKEDESPPLRILVFDTRSTCAKLFSKSISQYLKLGHINHPYVIAATLGPDRIHNKIGNERTQKLWASRVAAAPDRVTGTTYEHATNKLLRDADKLEQKGETLFVTEYAPFMMKHEVMLAALRNPEAVHSKQLSNPTVMPDEFLKMFNHLIIIQHPAIVIPSWFRLAKAEYGSYTVDSDDFTVWTSSRWSRILFDYLRSSNHQRNSSRVDSAHSSLQKLDHTIVSTRPLVVDADDVSNKPHATLAAVCRLLGIPLDANSIWTQYFSKATEALRKAVPNSLLKAFNTNILTTEMHTIDIDQETTKWTAEFGPDVTKILRSKVEDDLPHYEYLKSFKLRILPSFSTSSLMQNLTRLPYRRSSADPTPSERILKSPLGIIDFKLSPNCRSSESSDVCS